MKRFLQVASLFVVAALTAQPALAGLTCSMGTAASEPCAPHCPMAMGQMGIDCHMPQQFAGVGCQQDCCQYAFPQALALSKADPRPKAAGASVFLVVPEVPQVTRPASGAPTPGDLASAGPPRYILLQVFRI